MNRPLNSEATIADWSTKLGFWKNEVIHLKNRNTKLAKKLAISEAKYGEMSVSLKKRLSQTKKDLEQLKEAHEQAEDTLQQEYLLKRGSENAVLESLHSKSMYRVEQAHTQERKRLTDKLETLQDKLESLQDKLGTLQDKAMYQLLHTAFKALGLTVLMLFLFVPVCVFLSLY
ncbi:hypothetical protein EJ05DRAFT_477076 [Pseudovirgaria hyperparasitica]|uniref:Uncharacterized protein n=1 Tax=Pseudovirgaria hyperparasitica TaxID=470096 RepID=A0A6A6W487_9PEZI|nr:uncharacterized protein EJ05DRAFT_477076 [Pseudovirgaria hyperparasitica]KAF2756844.1 hypothetical protein EJ05DRAFT_477076 [Pseudovirgaria hyperparasitica]